MDQNQQQLVTAYKQEFQSQAGRAPKESDDQIAQKLRQQQMTQPDQVKQQARKDAEAQGGDSAAKQRS